MFRKRIYVTVRLCIPDL